MKKQTLIFGLFAILMTLSVFACGGGDTNQTEETTTEQPAEDTGAADEANTSMESATDTTHQDTMNHEH